MRGLINLNKNEGVNKFIEELETTGNIEVLNNKEEDELHKKLEVQYGNKLSEFVKAMKENNFSEFHVFQNMNNNIDSPPVTKTSTSLVIADTFSVIKW